MATHSTILAWKIPWVEEPCRLYSPWGRKDSDVTERLRFSLYLIKKMKYIKPVSCLALILIFYPPDICRFQ